MCLGICRNAIHRPDSSDFATYNFENKFLLYETEDSRWKSSWQSVESILHDSAVSLLNPFPFSAILPVSMGFNLVQDDAKFMEFSKSADDVAPFKEFTLSCTSSPFSLCTANSS